MASSQLTNISFDAANPEGQRIVKEQDFAKILLVADKPGDADLVRLRLVDSKFRINCVTRLEDALACLEVETPSLILLDPNLSDCSGAEAVRRIMQKASNVPVVILPGQYDNELAIKAVRQGAQDVVAKRDVACKNCKHLERSIRNAVERKDLESAMEVTRKRPLEFKDQFLSHVSHELRTPLTCIHQYVTLLLDGLAGPLAPNQTGHLKSVLKSTNQLHAMIRDLLEATRAES
ncbi:MAG: response regulator, partial [Terracidiphilus sp.]